MHEKRFHRDIERLRDPERLARLEVSRVVVLLLEKRIEIHSVLDIGTGSGIFAEQFAKAGLQVIGLDANPAMPSTASRFVPVGTFLQAAAEHLPFKSCSFDLVFMGLLLHETDDALAALREAQRVAVRQAAVLEWPYWEQPNGPPLQDRLSEANLTLLAQQAGFARIIPHLLKNLILYQLDK